MRETVEQLHDAQQIAEHVCRLLLLNMQQVPKFSNGNVPVNVAAEVYGKEPTWIRAGIIGGWLPIGIAIRKGEPVTDISQMDSKYGRIDYFISPLKLWKDTGFVWRREDEKSQIL